MLMFFLFSPSLLNSLFLFSCDEMAGSGMSMEKPNPNPGSERLEDLVMALLVWSVTCTYR
jgi:hypothetical protein